MPPIPRSLDAVSIEEHRDDREVGKLPPVGAALDRRRSRILGFWRVLGCDVIAPRRNNIAHLHRPWRAFLRICAISLPGVRKCRIKPPTARVKLYAGEIEMAGRDVEGIAVHIASRVSALARAGETLVSRTVKDLVAGSGLHFEERGIHQLKGLLEPMELYSASH